MSPLGLDGLSLSSSWLSSAPVAPLTANGDELVDLAALRINDDCKDVRKALSAGAAASSAAADSGGPKPSGEDSVSVATDDENEDIPVMDKLMDHSLFCLSKANPLRLKCIQLMQVGVRVPAAERRRCRHCRSSSLVIVIVADRARPRLVSLYFLLLAPTTSEPGVLSRFSRS